MYYIVRIGIVSANIDTKNMEQLLTIVWTPSIKNKNHASATVCVYIY